jgi:ribosomal protein L20A (L18A)
MRKYNVTGQVYSLFDADKQTLLMNEVIRAGSEYDAEKLFHSIVGINYKIIKIYSVEEISKVRA